MESLINSINNFRYYYAMSEDNRVWNEWTSKEREIEKEIETLSMDELKEVYSSIESRLLEFSFAKTIKEKIDSEPAPSKDEKKVSLFKTAWSFFKDGLFSSFSLALKAAWNRLKVLTALKNGVARFSYKRKSDGSTREAIGTLREGNYQYQYKGSKNKTKLDVIKYYDLTANAFRSFRIENLLTIS